MRLEVVRYDESRRPAVLALQRHLWSRDDDLNRRILDWRYVENPLVERPHIYLLLVDGEAAGMRGFLPARWRLGAGVGTEATVLLSACDLVLDPKHQAKGLVRHLMAGALSDLAAQGHRFALSFSAGAATSLLQQRQGWKQVADYDWLAVQSSRSVRAHRRRRALSTVPLGDRIGSRLVRWLEGPAFGLLQPERDIELAPAITGSAQPRLAAMAALIRDAPADANRLRAAPSEHELAWRFGNPLRRYRFLYYEEEGSVLGFLALSARRTPDPGVVITELRAVSSTIEERLLDALVSIEAPRITAWSTGLSSSALATMHRLGFSTSSSPGDAPRYRPGFLARPTMTPEDPASWQLFGLDLRATSSWELRPLVSDAY